MLAFLRRLCTLTGHSGPGSNWYMDETGEFAILDCLRCRTVIIQDLTTGHDKADFEAVLDRWLVDWRED